MYYISIVGKYKDNATQKVQVDSRNIQAVSKAVQINEDKTPQSIILL